MYNKLFSKILDSSIWLEDDHIRLVWITFLAVMDQDGVVALSGIGNVALRARVSEDQAADAIKCLESPDDKNPDQDNEGRRIERIAGVGWFVLNAAKYRDIIKAEDARAATRERVRRHRAKSNADVTECNDLVTLSDTDTNTEEDKKGETPPPAEAFAPPRNRPEPGSLFYHPVIESFRTVTKQSPPKESWPHLIKKLGKEIDIVRLTEAYARWRAKGYKTTNFDGIAEFYLEKETNGTNKNSYRQQRADEAVQSRNRKEDIKARLREHDTATTTGLLGSGLPDSGEIVRDVGTEPN
jgi:hypothetical protein